MLMWKKAEVGKGTCNNSATTPTNSHSHSLDTEIWTTHKQTYTTQLNTAMITSHPVTSHTL